MLFLCEKDLLDLLSWPRVTSSMVSSTCGCRFTPDEDTVKVLSLFHTTHVLYTKCYSMQSVISVHKHLGTVFSRCRRTSMQSKYSSL